MSTNTWQPKHADWGDDACRETIGAYRERLLSRAMALCVWSLARDAGTTLAAVRALAARDARIGPAAGDREVTADALARARKILGLAEPALATLPEPAPAEDPAATRGPAAKPAKTKRPRAAKTAARPRAAKRGRKASLSKIEKALLSEFKASTALLDAYRALAAELDKVGAAFEHARSALAGMPLEHALTLAALDADTRALLIEAGVITGDETFDLDPAIVVLADDED